MEREATAVVMVCGCDCGDAGLVGLAARARVSAGRQGAMVQRSRCEHWRVVFYSDCECAGVRVVERCRWGVSMPSCSTLEK